MKSILTPVFLFTLFSFTLNAQYGFQPGYIITLENEIVKGKINNQGIERNTLVCNFTPDTDTTQVIKYTPNDIKGFRIVEGRYYISKSARYQGSHRTVFMEFLLEGEINLYHLREGDISRYFIEKDTMPFRELVYEKQLKDIKVNGVTKSYLVEDPSAYKGVLRYYMHDSPQLFTRIDDLRTPDHKTLIKLGKDYHHNVCKDGVCMEYYSKEKKRIYFIEPVYRRTLAFDDDSPYGGNSMGVNVVFLNTTNTDRRHYSIGLIFCDNGFAYFNFQAQFIYLPDKKLHPLWGAGMRSFGIFDATLGLQYELLPKISLQTSLTTAQLVYQIRNLSETQREIEYHKNPELTTINFGLRYRLH